MNFRSATMGEDCLYLNIWTPAKSANAKLPVLVYFYGGGFIAGLTAVAAGGGTQTADDAVQNTVPNAAPHATAHADHASEKHQAFSFGRMYSYASRVPVEDRWAIAAYIRALQLSQHATAADVDTKALANLKEGKLPTPLTNDTKPEAAK